MESTRRCDCWNSPKEEEPLGDAAAGMEQGNGKVIGDWVLDQHIGAGSFAVVWKARHAVTGQVVAIKEISTDKLNKKLKLSLESEVSILKQITHRNIVQLLEVIEVRLPLYCRSNS